MASGFIPKSYLCFSFFSLYICLLLSRPSSTSAQETLGPNDLLQPTVRFVYNDPVGTTPAICPENQTCGFMMYDLGKQGQYYPTEMIHFCNCPDDLKCLFERDNLSGGYWYYSCQDGSNPRQLFVTTPMESDASAKELVTQGSNHLSATAETASSITDRTGYFADRNEL